MNSNIAAQVDALLNTSTASTVYQDVRTLQSLVPALSVGKAFNLVEHAVLQNNAREAAAREWRRLHDWLRCEDGWFDQLSK